MNRAIVGRKVQATMVAEYDGKPFDILVLSSGGGKYSLAFTKIPGLYSLLLAMREVEGGCFWILEPPKDRMRRVFCNLLFSRIDLNPLDRMFLMKAVGVGW